MYESTIIGLVGPPYPCCSLVALCAFTWLSLCAFGAFGACKIFSLKNKEFKTALITHSFTIWGYQDKFKPVYFFYKKILHVQKHSCLQQHIDSNPSNLFICSLTNFYEFEINTYTHWGFCLRASVESPELGSCKYRCAYMNLVVGTSVFSTSTLRGLFSFFCFLFFTRTKSTKQTVFILLKVFMRALLVGFSLWRVFVYVCACVCAESFCKKIKIKRLKLP